MPRRRKVASKKEREIAKVAQAVIYKTLETKHHLVESTSADASSTITLVDLSAVTRGDGQDTRDGGFIDPSQLSFKYSVLRPTSATLTDIVRVSLIQWRPNTSDDAPASITDIYQSDNLPVLSPFRYENANFKVLYDRTHQLAQYSATQSPVGWYKIGKRTVFGKHLSRISFDSGGATTGKNHIYLVVLGTIASGANASDVNYYSKLSFKDI